MSDRLSQLADTWPKNIPFERAVRQQLNELHALVRHGVTWVSISAALTEAGVRKKKGGPLSARQMNTVFLRSAKKARRLEKRVLRGTADTRRSGPCTASARSAEIPTQIPLQEECHRVVKPSDANAQTANSELRRRLVEARRYRQSRKSDFEE